MTEATTTRVAIVTGAARGIGAATALRLAAGRVRRRRPRPGRGRREGHGRRDRGRRGAGAGRRCRRRDSEQVQAAVERVAAELGAPTVLINNAGVTRDNMLFKMTETDWDTVMNVHLRGAFLMTRAVQKHMIEAEVGPDRQPLQRLGARQPRPGQLLDRQGRAAGLHQDPRHRARQVRRHRQRDRPRLHRDRDDHGDRRAHGHPVRRLHQGRRRRRSRSPAWASPRTSRTGLVLRRARAPASSPARSSTPRVARAPDLLAVSLGPAVPMAIVADEGQRLPRAVHRCPRTAPATASRTRTVFRCTTSWRSSVPRGRRRPPP